MRRSFLLSMVLGLGLAALDAAPAEARFTGHNAPKASLRTAPLPRPSGNIRLYAENTREEVSVNIYKPDGSYDPTALAQLDHLFRDYRRDEVRAVDPRLYELLSIVYDHFGGRRLLLGSGFRVERNTSRHNHASAADFRVEGVSYKAVHAFVVTLDQGGMGIGQYPTTEFVHMDFRAPGEPSFRWVDTSGSDRKARAKKKAGPAKPKVTRRGKPNS